MDTCGELFSALVAGITAFLDIFHAGAVGVENIVIFITGELCPALGANNIWDFHFLFLLIKSCFR